MHGNQSLVFGITFLSALLAGKQSRADLHFPKPTVELGKVLSGKPLRHVFPFTNRGSGVVEILDARASCGCLSPQTDKRAYQPGEKGELVLEVNPLSQPAGRNSWHVTLVYRDEGETVEKTLGLTATLVREIDVQPTAITIIAASPIAHEIVLTDLRDKALKVMSVECSSSKILGSVREGSKNAAGRQVCKVRVKLAGDCPDGRHDEAVVINTNDPDYPEFKIPVTIVKQSSQRLSALPNHVNLTAPFGQAVPSQILRVRSPRNETVIVDRITADHPAVVTSWAPGPGTMATVKVTVDRARLSGNELQTHLHVHVRTPVHEVLSVPVTCNLK